MTDKDPSLRKTPEALDKANNILKKYCEKDKMFSEKQKLEITKKSLDLLQTYFDKYGEENLNFLNEKTLDLLFLKIFDPDGLTQSLEDEDYERLAQIKDFLKNPGVINYFIEDLENNLNFILLSIHGKYELAEKSLNIINPEAILLAEKTKVKVNKRISDKVKKISKDIG